MALLQRGNLIVTSRDRCDEHVELMKKNTQYQEMLAHWHKSVMYVCMYVCRLRVLLLLCACDVLCTRARCVCVCARL